MTSTCEGVEPKTAPLPTGTPCAKGVCSDGSCVSTLCIDGKKDGTETDTDCGGDCPKCDVGKACSLGSDCSSLVCDKGVCAAASCSDHVKNGGETGVDCGGSCDKCADGGGCATGADCASGVCTAMACVAASCADGTKNGTETDVDCGGGCAVCPTGKSCGSATDCASSVCKAGSCAAPACDDGVKNGTESAIDCGGGCSACVVGATCTKNGDCASTFCLAGVCTAPSCTDGYTNGTETDVDCGGSCAPCKRTQGCVADKDCTTGSCFFGRCAFAGFELDAARADWVGTSPIWFSTGDFDEDGRLDLLEVAATGDFAVPSELRFVRNLGARRFATKTYPSTNEYSQKMGAGDVDGDGHLDAVLLRYDGHVVVRRGDGKGAFGPEILAPFEQPKAVAVADLDGDGKADFVVGNEIAVTFYSFAAGAVLQKATFAGSATSFELADLDLDGDLDAISIPGSASSATPAIYENAGGFVFGAPRTVASMLPGTTSVATGDFDSDGLPDLLTVSGGSLFFVPSKGGAFDTRQWIIVPDAASSFGRPLIGDLDADGRLDIVVPSDSSAFAPHSYEVGLGKGDGTFTFHPQFTPHTTRLAAMADFDGDCRPDLASLDQDGAVDLAWSHGSGTWSTSPIVTDHSMSSTVIVDFDKDGKPDVVSIGALTDSSIVVWRNLGGFHFELDPYVASKGTSVGLAAGDFDGDGRVDFASAVSQSRVEVHLRNTDGSIKAAVDYPVGLPATSIAAGDLDKDGHLDLVIGTAYFKSGGLVVLRGKGDGTFYPRTDFYTSDVTSLALADLDGDGDLDVASNSNGALTLTRNDAGTLKTWTSLGPAALMVYAVDLDGDGKPELVDADFNLGLVFVKKNLGGSFASELSFPTLPYPQEADFADVDGDGRIDMLVTTGYGTLSVLRARGVLDFAPPTSWSIGGVRALARDFDADGKVDAVAVGGFAGNEMLHNVAGLVPLACPTCGDGKVGEPESCDDGNVASGDGCTSCRRDLGWTCTGSPSVCTPVCGDRLRRGVEACDDGNTIAGDGCSGGCAVETGWTCSAPTSTAPSACRAICGDGLVRGDELCDDGNVADGDACPSTCRRVLWSRVYGDDKGSQQVTSVSKHPAGGVVIGGIFGSAIDLGSGPVKASSTDGFVARVDASGKILWSKTFVGYATLGAVAVDAAGNTYVGGSFSGTTDFGGGAVTASGSSDAFLFALDATGALLWAKRYGDGNTQAITALQLDPSGNLVVAGTFAGSIDLGGGALVEAGGSDMFLAKLTSAGAHVWSKRYGDATKPQRPNAVATDAAGNIWIAGEFEGTLDFGVGAMSTLDATDAFIAKLSPSGVALFSKSYGVNNNYDRLSSIAVDSSGVVAAGTFSASVTLGATTYPTKGSTDGFVVALDLASGFRWGKVFGASDAQSATGVAVDGSGNAWIVGFSGAPLDLGGGLGKSDGMFVVKLASSSGAYQWSAMWANGQPLSVAADTAGVTYVGGRATGPLAFDTPPTYASSTGDAVLVKLAP